MISKKVYKSEEIRKTLRVSNNWMSKVNRLIFKKARKLGAGNNYYTQKEVDKITEVRINRLCGITFQDMLVGISYSKDDISFIEHLLEKAK